MTEQLFEDFSSVKIAASIQRKVTTCFGQEIIYILSLKCRVSTTAQFAVNYMPQYFNANAPCSVLSWFIVIESMSYDHIRGERK